MEKVLTSFGCELMEINYYDNWFIVSVVSFEHDMFWFQLLKCYDIMFVKHNRKCKSLMF